jgi:hypothetical protein
MWEKFLEETKLFRELVYFYAWFYVRNVILKEFEFRGNYEILHEHDLSMWHRARTRYVMSPDAKFNIYWWENRDENENEFEMRNEIFEKWNGDFLSENEMRLWRNEMRWNAMRWFVATSNSRREFGGMVLIAVVQRERHFQFAERTRMMG